MAGDTNVNICDFTVKEVKCSQERFINISELSTSKQMNICSSTNSLPSFVNNKQRICNAHLKHFDNKLSLRKLKPTCNLPDTMKHLTHTLTPMARKRKSTSYRPKNANIVKVNLDSQWCREIAYITGLILPLGTGMCGVCYKRLRQEKKAIETGVADEIAGADQTTEFQKQSSKRKRHDSETDELREVEEVADHDFNITNQCAIKELRGHRTKQQVEGRPHRSCPPPVRYGEDHETLLLLSDDPDTDVPNSQISVDSTYTRVSRLASLNSLLKICDVSEEDFVPEIKGTYELSSVRTQERYQEYGKQCLSLVADCICPGEGQFLKRDIMEAPQQPTPTETLQVLADVYDRTKIPLIRKQILSIITKQADFDHTKELIPGMTRYRFYDSQKHSKTVGVGMPVVTAEKCLRQRIPPALLDHFIRHITSSEVIKDLPFGEKTLRLTNGEILVIPSVVRSLAPKAIIDQYVEMCKEQGIKHLGESFMFKILRQCSATVRKSVEGLDNFVMEGSRAFMELGELLLQLGRKDLHRRLMEVKKYLKTDFKRNLSQHTSVKDHCINHALSFDAGCFVRECDSDHPDLCTQCMDVDNVLVESLATAVNCDWPNKDATLFKVERDVDVIRELRSHIVRCKNQEVAREDIIQQMKVGDILITCDWAMKFLPRRYREGQQDWFAKRGINWHVTVTLMKTSNGLNAITHLHLFDHQASQDAQVTAAVINDVVKDLKKSGTVRNIHVFSDNAGAYKSSSTILSLRKSTGTALKTFNFSEAQNGKGACDRRASHAKMAMRRYVDEGRDITTASEMKMALDNSSSRSKFKVKVTDPIFPVDDGAKTKKTEGIDSISSYYNFTYEKKGVRMWKAYGIGTGQFMPYTKDVKPVLDLKVIQDWTDVSMRILDIEGKKEPKTRTTYSCPDDACGREFVSLTALDTHIMKGVCDHRDEKMCSLDRAKYTYHDILNDVATDTDQQLPTTDNVKIVKASNTNTADIVRGWALKKAIKKSRFNEKQKSFIKEKFDIGKKTGCKADPILVAEEMRLCGRFSKNEFLLPTQIASAFSRRAQKERKMDMAAAHEETVLQKLKLEIQNEIQAD